MNCKRRSFVDIAVALAAIGSMLLVSCQDDQLKHNASIQAPTGVASAKATVLSESVFATSSPYVSQPTDTVMQSGTQLTPGVVVHLDNPRGSVIMGQRSVLVADSGDPASPYSGKVVQIDPRGNVGSLQLRFSSYVADSYGERYVLGLSDVAAANDGVYALMGVGAWLEEPFNANNRLIRIASDGSISNLFDVAAFEMEHNPDRNEVDANASGLAVGIEGTLWVTDAAGNWLVQLAPSSIVDSLKVETVTVFPAVDGEEAVPTGIAVGPDGSAYVTLFRCQQPTSGKGGVARIMLDGSYEIVVTDLSNPIDVAFDASGRLYVLEFAVDYAAKSGRLLAVQADGQIDTLLDGLTYPTSLAINEEGDVYITEIASPGGGPAGSGRLVVYESLVSGSN